MRRPLVLLVVALISAAAYVRAADAQANKLVVIVLENEPYDGIVGNIAKAPYLNSLISKGLLFTDYTAVTSGSGHNYLAMTSGLTFKQSPPSLNVFQGVDATRGSQTWMEFEESMAANCGAGSAGNVPGTSVALYTAGHDPAFQYRKNESCTQNDVPMTPTTFVPSALPDFSYVVPNECDDMHTLPTSAQPCPAYFGPNAGTSRINMGDNWLRVVVGSLLAQSNVTVLLTWDESATGTTPPEHILTLEVGAGVTLGSSDPAAYNHYGLEAGLYSYLGLGPPPNNGASAALLPIP